MFSASLDDDGVAFLARGGLGLVAVGVADDAVADADPVAFAPPFLHQGAALGHLKGLLRAVAPAASESDAKWRYDTYKRYVAMDYSNEKKE